MRGCRARTKKDGNERERERELKRRLLLELNEAVANVKIIAAKLKRVMRTSAEGGSKMTKRQTAAKHTAKERANQPTKRGMSTGGATSLTPKNRKKASAAIKTIVRKPIPTKVAANTARKPGPPIDVTAIHSVSRKHDRKVTYMVSTDGLVANQIPFHFDAANRTDQCKLLRLLNGFYDSDFLCEGGANAHMRPTVAKHIEMLTESIAASGQGNAHSFPPVPGSPDWLTAGHTKKTQEAPSWPSWHAPTVLSVALYTAPIELRHASWSFRRLRAWQARLARPPSPRPGARVSSRKPLA
jgi:hypothetical protein